MASLLGRERHSIAGLGEASDSRMKIYESSRARHTVTRKSPAWRGFSLHWAVRLSPMAQAFFFTMA